MRHSARLSPGLLALLAAVAGCERSPVAMFQEPVPIQTSHVAVLVDATNGGTAGFYFLPPTIETTPAYSGTFDGSLLTQLSIELCELDAAGICPEPPLVTYTATARDHRNAIRLNRAREQYFVYWNVVPASAASGQSYRARVLAAGAELGYIDFREPVAGRWLPIAFRVETGALDGVDPPDDPPPSDPPTTLGITSNAHDSRVGSGLQHGIWTFTLAAPAPTGGLDVELRSSDPSLLLVTNSPTTPGSAVVTVPVAAGSATGTFLVQGMEDVTGTTTIEFSAAGYAGNATIDVVPVAADIVGLNASISLAGPDVPFQVRVGAVDETGTGFYAQQRIRAGGTPLTFTLSNSDAAVARLVTSAGADQIRTVSVEAGESLSAANVADGGIAFDAVGSGATTVVLSHATVSLLAGATQNVTVTAGLNVSTSGVRVGSGLQQLVTVILEAPAPAGGLTIHLESSDPGVLLLAPNATTLATGAISITANAGTGGAGFYIAGVEGAVGTAIITATSPGYTTGVGTVTVTPVGVNMLFLANSQNVGVTDPFRVQVGALNQSHTGLYTQQAVRFGGTPIVVDITNSDAAVAQLVTSAGAAQAVTVTVPVGQGRSPADLAGGGVEFDPLAPGQTTVSASGTDLVQVPGATLVVTVN